MILNICVTPPLCIYKGRYQIWGQVAITQIMKTFKGFKCVLFTMCYDVLYLFSNLNIWQTSTGIEAI